MVYTLTLTEHEAALIAHRIDNYVIESVERELEAASEESRSNLSVEHGAWIQVHMALLDSGR